MNNSYKERKSLYKFGKNEVIKTGETSFQGALEEFARTLKYAEL
jgi:hypothetical protein